MNINRIENLIIKRKEWLPVVISSLALAISVVALLASLLTAYITFEKYTQLERPRIEIVQTDNENSSVYYLSDNNGKKLYTAIFRVKIINPSNTSMIVDNFTLKFISQEKGAIYNIENQYYKDLKMIQVKKNNTITPIFIDQFLVTPFEVQANKIKEGYIIIQGYFDHAPSKKMYLIANTQHGSFYGDIEVSPVQDISIENTF